MWQACQENGRAAEAGKGHLGLCSKNCQNVYASSFSIFQPQHPVATYSFVTIGNKTNTRTKRIVRSMQITEQAADTFAGHA